MKRNVAIGLKTLLLSAGLGQAATAQAPLYPPEREKQAVDQIRTLLTDYLTALNAIGNVRENADERKLYYTPEFEKAFRKTDALVFNDIDPEQRTEPDIAVNRYSVNHILWFPKTGVVSSMKLQEAVFGPISKTETGSLYLNAYVQKRVEGVFQPGIKPPIKHQMTNWLEFKIGFLDKGRYFTDYKIIGIARVGNPPGRPATPSAPTAPPAANQPPANEPLGRLLAVLTTLTQQLKENGVKPNQRVRLENFTYGTTDMGSQFSKVLNAYLSVKLRDQVGVRLLASGNDPFTSSAPTQPAKRTQPTAPLTLPALPDSADWVLGGTYTEEGGVVRLHPTLEANRSAKPIALPEQQLALKDIQELKAEVKPENYQQAVATQKSLEAGTIPNDFEIDILVNRDPSNLTLTEGDSLQLYVRAAKPCYIRLVYHMADGQRLLLFDNYYIDAQNTSQYIRIAKNFEVTSPFGAETLQLNAATKPFPSLQVTSTDGNDLINDDIATINRKNRQIEAGTSVKRAETRLVVTTTHKLKQ